MRERLLLLEADQENHEKVCATRWGVLLKVIGWGGGLGFTTLLAVAAWGLTTIHAQQQQQLDLLQTLSSKIPAAHGAP